MIRTLTAFLLALAALLAAPALATPSAAQLAAAKQAEARGAQIYAYDQAAWHATDAWQEERSKYDLSAGDMADLGLKGYIVEPAEDDMLLTTFFGIGKDGKRFAHARYWVRGSTVLRGGFVKRGEDNSLSPLAMRLIDAREAALAQAIKDQISLCSRSSPNFVVLPPGADGIISAYILTSTTVDGIYPAGGHFRYDYGAQGKLVAQRPFMKSCFPIDTRPKDGKAPVGIGLTHLLDPQPTEIHVFVSYNIPVPLYVMTQPNKEVWRVQNGTVTLLDKEK